MDTTKGSFFLETTRSLAPLGADRFYHLVESGFYDDSRFFRVVPGRFVQFGIAGNPAIAQIWRKAEFPDDKESASNARGWFGFAMTGPERPHYADLYLHQRQHEAPGRRRVRNIWPRR